jgi:hypothetical protein
MAKFAQFVDWAKHGLNASTHRKVLICVSIDTSIYASVEKLVG